MILAAWFHGADGKLNEEQLLAASAIRELLKLMFGVVPAEHSFPRTPAYAGSGANSFGRGFVRAGLVTNAE